MWLYRYCGSSFLVGEPGLVPPAGQPLRVTFTSKLNKFRSRAI